MGGGENYYDLSVQRQTDPGAVGRHDITNDANVVSMVRFAQYLDSVGQHGNYSPEMYAQFQQDTGGTGSQFQGRAADGNLLQTLTDNRSKPGPEASSPTSPSSFIQGLLQNATGSNVNGALDQAGQQANQNLDSAGRQPPGWVPGWAQGAYSWAADQAGNASQWALDQAGNLAGRSTDETIRWLQGMGMDTSHIRGMEQYQGNNPSVTRGWSNLVGQDPSQTQTLPIRQPAEPSPVQGARRDDDPSQMYAN